MKMEHKVSLKMLVIFLGFCYILLSSTPVTATRTLKSNNENLSLAQDLLAQDSMEFSETEELFGVGGEGRMDMESTDYPGTGANNHHDPKTPGRA